MHGWMAWVQHVGMAHAKWHGDGKDAAQHFQKVRGDPRRNVLNDVSYALVRVGVAQAHTSHIHACPL